MRFPPGSVKAVRRSRSRLDLWGLDPPAAGLFRPRFRCRRRPRKGPVARRRSARTSRARRGSRPWDSGEEVCGGHDGSSARTNPTHTAPPVIRGRPARGTRPALECSSTPTAGSDRANRCCPAAPSRGDRGPSTIATTSPAFVRPDFVLANAIPTADQRLAIIEWIGAGRGPRLWSLGFLLWASGRGACDSSTSWSRATAVRWPRARGAQAAPRRHRGPFPDARVLVLLHRQDEPRGGDRRPRPARLRGRRLERGPLTLPEGGGRG